MQNGLGNYTHSMPSDFWDRVAREVAHRLVGQYGGLGQLGQLGQQTSMQAQAGIQGVRPGMQQGIQRAQFNEQRTVT